MAHKEKSTLLSMNQLIHTLQHLHSNKVKFEASLWKDI